MSEGGMGVLYLQFWPLGAVENDPSCPNPRGAVPMAMGKRERERVCVCGKGEREIWMLLFFSSSFILLLSFISFP